MAAKTPYSCSVRPRARKDGTVAYDVRYRYEGKQPTMTFNSAVGAEKWANILRQVGPGEAFKFLQLELSETSPTVNEYAERYIASLSGVEGKTTDHYRMYIRLHIGPVMGALPIDAVDPLLISKWINDQHEAGVASKTIKNRHGFLSAMFQSAVEADRPLLDRNPCRRSRIPETESEEMVFLNANEFTTLLGYIPPKYQPIVYLLAATGLRWGEATALRPGDIDLDAGELRVSRAWKSSKAKGWYIGPPKTKKSKRTVSLPPDLLHVLEPLMATKSEYLFTNAYGKPIRQQNFHGGVWTPALRLAMGLPAFEKSKLYPERDWTPRSHGVWDREPAAVPLTKHPRPHDLRHSHASWLLEEGVGIDVVQRRLGHESIKTTVDRYGHISAARMSAASSAIGGVLAGAMPQLTS